MPEKRSLVTRRGTVTFPAVIPVTTDGLKYPLDNLLRWYLPVLCQAAMVSYPHAQALDPNQRLPLWIDSGGFVSLAEGARVRGSRRDPRPGEVTYVTDAGRQTLRPIDVIDFQERVADVAFTLDFPVPAGASAREAARRLELTLRNAVWALENRRRRDLPLFACVQGTDAQSYRRAARDLACHKGFAGFAVGGLVPKLHDTRLITEIVEGVRAEVGDDALLHVFGVGKPELASELFDRGVDSLDSSAYVKLAAAGRLWGRPDLRVENPTVTTRAHLALCNLALATQAVLPLSAARMFFSTHSIDRHLSKSHDDDDSNP